MGHLLKGHDELVVRRAMLMLAEEFAGAGHQSALTFRAYTGEVKVNTPHADGSGTRSPV